VNSEFRVRIIFALELLNIYASTHLPLSYLFLRRLHTSSYRIAASNEYFSSAYFKTGDESTIKIEFDYHQNIHIVGFGV